MFFIIIYPMNGRIHPEIINQQRQQYVGALRQIASDLCQDQDLEPRLVEADQFPKDYRPPLFGPKLIPIPLLELYAAGHLKPCFRAKRTDGFLSDDSGMFVGVEISYKSNVIDPQKLIDTLTKDFGKVPWILMRVMDLSGLNEHHKPLVLGHLARWQTQAA